ncbi:MAG: beta-lactamase family protein [Alphaproteobacteria bacterium]|nr:beta-lactamase family protein [Alphaproteobacteria bacterium]
MGTRVFGTVASGFEPVADAFGASFDGLPDMGAGLSVRVEGETVVDLWGGVADARDGRAWQADTPTLVFSCTKGLVAIVAAQLVAEGRLDYDAPVARYWPDFAANGKAGATIADALSHRAGLSAPRRDLGLEDVLDWDRMVAVLAEQEPLWVPGTGHAYHAITHGWLNGEVIRRVTGKSVGANLAERIAAPLAVDMTVGRPEALRVPPAHVVADPALSQFWRDEAAKPEPNWLLRSMTLGHALPADLVTPDGGFNDPRLQAAEIPGAGGIASARALATIWSATVTETNGVRLLDGQAIRRATTAKSFGPQVFPVPEPYCSWGLGLQLDSPARRYLTARSFGHDGAGGQVQFADPEHRIGFGFVTNWMMGPDDTRATRIIDALRTLVH